MVDVQHLKDKGIPIRIDGSTRYVKGATKYTTCSDVIKMVLKKTGIGKEYRHLFAIFEVSLHEEKQIPCKSRIVKVIEAWGGAQNKLVLRKTEPLVSSNAECMETKVKSKGKKSKSPVHSSTQDSYLQTLVSLAKFVEKQKNILESNRQMTSSEDSTSDSDSSMDEFLSNLDRSKMAGFVHFFAAMAGGKPKRAAARSRTRTHVSDTDDSSEHSPGFSRKHQWRNRPVRKSRQPTKPARKLKKSSADGIHPNKIHKVERINFGFIDVEPNSRDQVYTHVSRDENINPPRDPRSRLHSSRPCTARRRLLVGKKYGYCLNSKTSSTTGLLKDINASFHDDDCMTHGTYRQIQPEIASVVDRRMSLPGGSTGYHGNRKQTLRHDRMSTDFDQALTTSFDVSRSYSINRSTELFCQDLHRNGLSPILDNNAVTDHRLVDYTITDDECEEIDSEPDSVLSKCSLSSGSTSSSLSSDSNVRKSENEIENSGSDIANINHVTKMADNLNISDYIRSIFSKNCAVSEDEEMNSFMKSMLCEDELSSDEGLSSMESGMDKNVKL